MPSSGNVCRTPSTPLSEGRERVVGEVATDNERAHGLDRSRGFAAATADDFVALAA